MWSVPLLYGQNVWYHAARALLSMFSNIVQVVAAHSIRGDLAHTFDMKCYRQNLLIYS